MANYSKRIMITLFSELEEKLDKLKKEKFYNKTQAEMLRYIISCGLNTIQQENNKDNIQSK